MPCLVSQCDSTFFRQRFPTTLNAHGTNGSPAGSVHAHILTKPSGFGAVVSRLELVELGAAACVFRGTWLGHG